MSFCSRCGASESELSCGSCFTHFCKKCAAVHANIACEICDSVICSNCVHLFSHCYNHANHCDTCATQCTYCDDPGYVVPQWVEGLQPEKLAQDCYFTRAAEDDGELTPDTRSLWIANRKFTSVLEQFRSGDLHNLERVYFWRLTFAQFSWLQRTRRLRFLSLQHLEFSDYDFSEAKVTTLRKLSVLGSHISTDLRMKGICAALIAPSAVSLVTLDLDKNRIGHIRGGEPLNILMEILPKIHYLRVLSLRANLIRQDQFQTLCQIISDLPLRALKLDENRIEDLSPLVSVASRLTSLRVLTLNNNPIPELCIFQFPQLHYLHLDGCRVSDSGVDNLVRSFEHIASLRHLYLDDNQTLSDAGLENLARGLPQLTALTDLSLGDNRLGQRNISPLCSSFESLRSLKALHLHFNRLRPPQLAQVFSSLRENIEQIEIFAIDENNFLSDDPADGRAAVEMACETLRRGTNLRWLRMNGCNLDDQSVSDLISVTLPLPKLERLRVERFLGQLIGFPNDTVYSTYIHDVYIADSAPLHLARAHPLFLASGLGNVDQILRLVQARCDVNFAEAELGETALHVAARNNRVEAIRALIHEGLASLSIKNKKGQTAAEIAVEGSGARTLLEEMVYLGADERPSEMIKSAAKRFRPLPSEK